MQTLLKRTLIIKEETLNMYERQDPWKSQTWCLETYVRKLKHLTAT